MLPLMVKAKGLFVHNLENKATSIGISGGTTTRLDLQLMLYVLARLSSQIYL